MNLGHRSRTDSDVGTLVGMKSAGTILSGIRTNYHFDPVEIGNRGEGIAFAFKMPSVKINCVLVNGVFY